MKLPGLLLGLAIMAVSTCRANAAVAGCGATVPWTSYEAEAASTTGTVIGPDFTGQTPAREASGRRCVRLAATGQHLDFSARADAQAIVVRYCIPDSPRGGGMDATLSLYINGSRRSKLPLTSKYAYLYGKYPYSNDPSQGTARHFWDEIRLMPGEIHRGDVIRLLKEADDSASEYLVDLIDLEVVPPASVQPENSVSITDFGAEPDGRTDIHTAFVSAIAAAKSQHKAVWIPAGHYLVKGAIELSDVDIQGAGMWYSTLVAAADYTPANRLAVLGGGSNIKLADFAIIGNLNYRDDVESNDGIGGSFGTGSSIRNLWVEHTKTGAWLVNSDGLLVEGCRFRDTIADGINLCIGMRNTIVRNCSVRGNGDDCFAMWPATYMKATYSAGLNHFINCTAQLPFLAQAFSIYGGEGNTVENCEAIDIPYGAGLFASTTFPTGFGFRGVTSFTHSRITRTGDSDGAIGTFANLRDLSGLRFKDLEVIDSPCDGIKFTSVNRHALADTQIDGVRILRPGISGAGHGITVARGAAGSATLTGVSVLDAKTAAVQNNSTDFRLIQNEASVGLLPNQQPVKTAAGARDLSSSQ